MRSVRESIVWQLILPIPIVLFVAVLAIWIAVPRVVNSSAHDNAVVLATDIAQQFKVLRRYYTNNVVEKVVRDGHLRVSDNHKNETNSIPLPATVIHDLSALLESSDTTVELFSAYPFPNRASRVLDEFQERAWAALVANPDQVFTRQENRDGQSIVRVAVADRMVSETCVSCHNTHPDTPRDDWALGDVRGALVVNVDIGEFLAAGHSLGSSIVLAVLLGGSLLILLCVLAARRVTVPLIDLKHAMDRLCRGDTDTDIPSWNRIDEIGAMARSLGVFKEHMVRTSRSKSAMEKEVRLRKSHEVELRKAHQTLEARVAKRTKELGEEMARGQRAKDELHEAIEHMSEGFAIYDTDDRLVLCNDRNREIYAESADLFVHGAHIEDIIRASADRGQYLDESEDREAWVTWRLERFRNPSGVFVERLKSGRWIQISERKTRNGRTICVRTDITRQKKREQEIAEKSEQLEVVLENMDQGISMADQNLNLVVFNQRFLDIQGFPPDRFKRGDSFESTIRFNAERGDYGEGNIDELVNRTMEMVKRFEVHRVNRTLPNGTTMEIRGNPVPGGGWVTTFTDVTAMKEHEMELGESEAKIRAVLDNTADSIITVDESGTIDTINREAERSFGYESQELLGRDIATLLIASDDTEQLSDLSRFVDTDHEGLRHEVECRRKNGTTFTADLAVGELVLGQRRLFVGIFTDITERKRTEAALIAGERRLRTITDNLFEGVLVVDPDGHIIFANPSARKLVGRPDDNFFGLNLDNVLVLRQAGREVGFADSPFRQAAIEGSVEIQNDAQVVLASGEKLDIAYACSPLLEHSVPQGAVISFRGIRELKEAQRETLQASKLASVGQLAAGIAHEINTPAQYIGDNLRFLNESHDAFKTILAAYAELAEGARKAAVLDDLVANVDNATEENDLEYLLEEVPTAAAQSIGGIDQVSRIVLAMKEFSHPGTGEKTAVDLNRAVENTLAVSRNEWKDVAQADTQLDPDLPLVTCLPGQMNQVLLNLVINAAHAIADVGKEGGGLITITTRKDGDWAEIRVIDTGGGIPSEVCERVFDPFFTTKEVGKGTGQGLSICRDVIVDKHGGKIFIEPGTDTGTVFVVRIPIDGRAEKSVAA